MKRTKPADKPEAPDHKGRRAPLTGGHWVTIHYDDGESRHLYISGPAGHRGKVLAGGSHMGLKPGDTHEGKSVAKVVKHGKGVDPTVKRKSWQEKDRPSKLDF